METNIRERLIQYLEYKKISQYKFQKSVGVANGYVYKLGNSINTDVLIRINASYPDLNTTWLLKGVGEMINDSKSQSTLYNGGNVIENSHTGDVTQTINPSSSEAKNIGDSSKLYEQIVSLKDTIAKIKSQVFKASKCVSHEECVKLLDEIIGGEA